MNQLKGCCAPCLAPCGSTRLHARPPPPLSRRSDTGSRFLALGERWGYFISCLPWRSLLSTTSDHTSISSLRLNSVTSDPNAKKGVAKPSPKLNSAWRTGSSPSARGRGDLRDSASPSFAGSLNDPPFLLAMRIGELEPSSSHPPLLVFSLELASSPPFSPRAQLIQLDIPTPFVLFQLSG
mmetsp:Transcript_21927/g.50915  ORF Transcript_21927/g.50915 Transcript_21927/m.50915 type:complete len:181 (+) Transcript_21927:269-811(+)